MTQHRCFSIAGSIGKGLLMAGAVAMVTLPCFAQENALQEKVAAVKQSMAANKQQLSQYQWIETTQLTLKGDQKPPTQDMCQYGPDGTVQKTPMGPPPAPPSGRRLKQKVIANKTAEMKDYMGDVKSLIAMYVPPAPQRIEQARQANNISLNPGGGVVNLVFTNFVQQGDQMIIAFDTAAKKVVSLNINTYMGQEKDAVTLQVQMASLPDGTNYTQQTVLDAKAKQLVVTTTSSDYRRL
jgi:hypothetical protein